MVKLTQEMKKGLKVPGKGGSLVYLATSTIDGKPNIAAMRYVDSYKDDKILISDMFLLKTKMNLKENPECIIAVCHPLNSGRDWVFKGKAIDIEYGFSPDFDWYGVSAKDILDGWGDWHHKEPPDEVPPDVVYAVPAQRGVVVLHVEEIYSIEKGKVGEKIQ
jgi:predicted pyridoxine 5'-phosphate oxidase superfamily flavin-nucleotide-binding protein